MVTSYIYLAFYAGHPGRDDVFISHASLLQLHMQCFALSVGGIFFSRSTDEEYMLDLRMSMV